METITCPECGSTRDDIQMLAPAMGIDPAEAICCETIL